MAIKNSTAENQTNPPRGKLPEIIWDDSNMDSTYANVCNVASTREEVTLLFGTNQTWQSGTGSKDVTIKLSNRIIISPYAAKRLNMLLSSVVDQYEARFGKLNVEGASDSSAKN